MIDGALLEIEGLHELREIGRGGFATVYSGYQRSLNRRVAVKVFAAFDETGHRRFHREVRSMGTVDAHPHVVKPLTTGVLGPDQRPFLVMEYMAGGSLQELIDERGPLPVDDAIALVLPIADALGHSHRLGVLHRDVKPANVLLSATGMVKLGDFGIAAIREATLTDVVSFSLAYAPPETFDHRAGEDPRDERSDLYSLAATLSALVSGHAPFAASAGDSPAVQMVRIMEQPVPVLGHRALDAFLATAMAKRPADRFRTADEFIEALHRVEGEAPAPVEATAIPAASPGHGWARPVASDRPVHRPRWRRPAVVVAGAVLVATVLVGAALAGALPPSDPPDVALPSPSGTSPADPEEATESTEPGTGDLDLPSPGPDEPSDEQGPAGEISDEDPTDGATATFDGHTGSVTTLTVLSDGRVASIDTDGTVLVWDPLDAQSPPVTYRGEFGAIGGPLAALPDGRLVVRGPDQTVHVWDPADPNAAPVVFTGHDREIRAVAVLADGRVATGSYTSFSDFTGRVLVWDPADPGAEPIVYRGHASELNAIVQLPDGRIASASGDQTIHVWDPDEADADAVVFTGHRSTVISLLALPDGRVASGGLDRTVHIWDPDAPDAPGVVFEGHRSGTDGVYALALLDDGRIASASPVDSVVAEDPTLPGRGTVLVWDPDALDAAPIVHAAHEPGPAPTVAAAVVALGDGRLASTVGGNQIHVWNPDLVGSGVGSPSP